MNKRLKKLSLLACEQAPGKDRKNKSARAKQKDMRSDQGITGEPVDFDVSIRPWWLACNKSINEVIRWHVEKLYFLFL